MEKEKKVGWMLAGVFTALIAGIVVSMLLTMVKCDRKEWWEDWSKINVELSDPLATPNYILYNLKDTEGEKNLRFTYMFDGEEHYPAARILVDGMEMGGVLPEEKKIWLEEEGGYNPISRVIYPGRYMMTYSLFPTEDTSNGGSFSVARIYIEIIENI